MVRRIIPIPILLVTLSAAGQQKALEQMLTDSTMVHSSVSLSVINSASGETIIGHNASKSFSQASVMKLVTTAAAIEMLAEQVHVVRATREHRLAPIARGKELAWVMPIGSLHQGLLFNFGKRIARGYLSLG